MTLEEESRLSYYKKIGEISRHKNVELVQHTETGRIYVKKTQTVYDRTVYDLLYRMQDPFFPRIVECIESDGKLILIESYVSGDTLQDILNRGETFSLYQTADFMMQILDGLRVLHTQNPPIVHRDIKPSNIVLTDDGTLRMIDCNTARQYEYTKSTDTIIIGTEGYAAPEQYGFRQTDPRTDIYSLGVLTNMLLTGYIPQEHMYEGPVTPIIRKCVELDPENRYEDLIDLHDAWNELCRTEPTLREVKMRKQTEQSAMYWSTAKKRPNLNMLPGFRTESLSRMLLALFAYSIAILFPMSLDYTGSNGLPVGNTERWVNVICFWGGELACVLFCGNYRGIRSKFPLMKSKSLLVRVVMASIYCYLFFSIAVTICSFIDVFIL